MSIDSVREQRQQRVNPRFSRFMIRVSIVCVAFLVSAIIVLLFFGAGAVSH